MRGQLSTLVGQSVPLRRTGSGFSGLCPFHRERTPSLNVNDLLARFKCFGCGASGDAIDWVAQRDGVTPIEALEILERHLGLPSSAYEKALHDAGTWRAQRDRELADDQARKSCWARRLWRECRPIGGTIAEAYLRSRAITITPGASLAFHPGLRHPSIGGLHAGMVAAVTDAAGRVFGIHRTFLAADGQAKANLQPTKMMAGLCLGNCVRFGLPGAESGHVLAVGEGIESSLSVRQATGLPVWAALSLSNMGRVPVPFDGSVHEIVLLADADETDRAAADAVRIRAADAYSRAGFTVKIARPPEGTDFNDVLRGSSLRKAIEPSTRPHNA